MDQTRKFFEVAPCLLRVTHKLHAFQHNIIRGLTELDNQEDLLVAQLLVFPLVLGETGEVRFGELWSSGVDLLLHNA